MLAAAQKPTGSRGAVFLEFAIVLPLFLIVTLFFFEMGRYFAIYSTLNIGADEAVSYAAKAPGFEDPESDDWATTKTDVKARAKAIAVASLVGVESGAAAYLSADPEIEIPGEAGGNLERELANRPMRVTLRAQVKPILPFFHPMPIEVNAYAFREQRKPESLPIAVDCLGNPIGSEDYKRFECPCDADRYWSFWESKCVCNVTLNAATDTCGCPAGSHYNDTSTDCTCDTAQALNCGSNMYVKQTGWGGSIQCTCECNSGFNKVGGECVCPEGRSEQNGQCVCTVSCDGTGKILNSNQCSCSCSEITNPNGSCSCSSPFEVLNQQTGGCACSINQSNCPAHSTFNAATCDCDCNAPFVKNGDQCVCPDGSTEENGACVCDQTESCGVGAIWDVTLCQCICDTSKGFTTQGDGSCACPDLKTAINGSCQCAPQDCANGATQNASSCLCICQGGSSGDGVNSCACPTDKEFNTSGSCVCVTTACENPNQTRNSKCKCACNTTCNGGTVDQQTCACSCPTNKEVVNGSCVCSETCPEGMTQNSNCTCSCPNGQQIFDGRCVTNQCYNDLMASPELCSMIGPSPSECHCDE